MTKQTAKRTLPSAKPTQTPPAVARRTRSQAEQARVEAVVAKSVARTDGLPMKLKMVDGVLQIAFTHADTALAHT